MQPGCSQQHARHDCTAAADITQTCVQARDLKHRHRGHLGHLLEGSEVVVEVRGPGQVGARHTLVWAEAGLWVCEPPPSHHSTAQRSC
jgi:hypothetical protein